MKFIGYNQDIFKRRNIFGEVEISKVSGQPTLELSGFSETATAAHAGRIKFLKSGTASLDAYTAGDHTTAGEILGRIEAYGVNNNDDETLSSYIEFANDAISNTDSSPGKIVFATSGAADAGTPTVRLNINDDGLVSVESGRLESKFTGASSSSAGAKLTLIQDDGAVMANGHRLGVIEFKGAEDTSNTTTMGARIEAMCEAAWSASENGARLDFYTTDGDATESQVLSLNSLKLATFSGNLVVQGTSALNEFAAPITIEKPSVPHADIATSPALTVTDGDVDQKSVYINSSNTTANVLDISAQALTTANAIYVDCNSLTSGSIISLDIDDALTATASKSLINVDYDKSGVTASSQSSVTTGLNISMVDAATNNASGSVINTGVAVAIDAASNQGDISQTGYSATLTDGDTSATIGYYSSVEDGGVDFKAVSSADAGDFFSIATTTHGATTLTTFDDDADAAHFEIAANGRIILDSFADIVLEPGSGDVTIFDPVNDGNPTISLGSSATNRLEIKTAYNSGAQTIDEVYFSTYTTSGSTNDGRYIFEVDEVELARILDGGLVVSGNINASDAAAAFACTNTTASSATEGGKLRLISNDGAAMADNHRLGILTFEGAEDASSNLTVGAQIESFCDAGWSASENGARMVFSTTDGNASISTVLTLDSDKLATFSGAVNIQGSRSFINSMGTDGAHDGDVVYFGGTTSMTVGKIYHYKSDGTWEIANADAVATADGLLGVALGAASDTNGMLLRGMVTLDHDPGAIGDVLYVQSDNAGTPGNATATAPSASGDCVRIIGYQVVHAAAGIVWFNPDSTFIEVA